MLFRNIIIWANNHYQLLVFLFGTVIISWALFARNLIQPTPDEVLLADFTLTYYDGLMLLFSLLAFLYLIMAKEQTKNELELSELRYRSLYDESKDGIMLTKPNGEILHVNRAGCEILGMSEEEICKAGRQQLVVQDEKLEKALRIREETGVFSGELTFRHGSGNTITVELTSSIFNYNRKGDKRTSLIFRDISHKKKIEEQLNKNLKERTLLLEEVHHRVKNNLAIISGLLELQSNKNPQLEDVLNLSQIRIRAIAQIHEMLYQSDDFSAIDIPKYIRNLAQMIDQTLSSKSADISIETNIFNLTLTINQAIPFGLLINELITNSYKHAFKYSDNGAIQINVSTHPGNVVSFSYSDNGIGIPDLKNHSKLNTGGSLGFQLIRSLSKQLDARDIKINGKDGFSYSFQFHKL